MFNVVLGACDWVPFSIEDLLKGRDYFCGPKYLNLLVLTIVGPEQLATSKMVDDRQNVDPVCFLLIFVTSQKIGNEILPGY